VAENVASAAKQADIVIPFIHWGVEYILTPTDEQRGVARPASDAGATIVVGSHPHRVQGIEEHRGRPIVYSLGSFVFDQDWSAETKQGLIMHLVFQGPRLAALRLVPVVIENFYQPRIATGERR
jgi:poly-gamma-glutamate synthesis protein (capsule biosynthesis protein)